ncbi:hypothetical protein Tco_1129601, partial [Tanacetum coccineum]
MMTYLKNMGGYKHSQLKGKSYQEIQGLYERQQKRIQDFTPMDSEKEDQKPSKRLERVRGSYATQKSPKKLKVMKSAKDVTEEEVAEYGKEKEELRLSLKIISNNNSEVDYKPLSKKFPIVNWEYQLLGKMEDKDMQDLNDLYSCGVYTLFLDGKPMEINMLVEKKYPLIKELLEKMLNLQLEAKEESQARKKIVHIHEYILLPLWTLNSPISSSPKKSDDEVADDAKKKSTKDPANEGNKDDQDLREFERLFVQGKEAKININNTNNIFGISSLINTVGTKDADNEPMMPNTGIFGNAYDDEDFVAGKDMNNLESSMSV